MSKTSKILFLLLFLGLLLRIVVMFYSYNYRDNSDILRYKDWARISFLYGPEDTYHPSHLTFGTLPNNHPPGSLYIINTAYFLQIQFTKLYIKLSHQSLEQIPWINSISLNSFVRLPSILADLGIAYLIYKIVLAKKYKKNAYIATSVFLFNPVIIYNSSFWGQMDSLNNLLFYISFYFLYKNKYFLSILCAFLSLYIKLSLIFFLPVFLIVMYKMLKNKKKMILYICASFMSIFILTLPISSKPHLWLLQFVNQNSGGEIQNITAFAFNFWWMIFKPWVILGEPFDLFSFSQIKLLNAPLGQDVYFGFSLITWSAILFLIILSPFIYRLIRSQKDFQIDSIFLLFSLIALLAFLFLPRMHERYMYPVFPLLATYIGLRQRFFKTFIFLSILNLLNLYIIWHPMRIPLLTYSLMNSQNFQWLISVLTILTGAYFYKNTIQNEKYS